MQNSQHKFVLSSSLLSGKQQEFKAAETIMQNMAISYAAAYAPKKTGKLISSASVVNGAIIYSAPYARYQYYNTAQTRQYDANRGAAWFERMKLRHKNTILYSVANNIGAKSGGFSGK